MAALPPASRFKLFRFIRNTDSSKKYNPGKQFQADIEPAGRYMIEDEGGPLAPGWIRGVVQFSNPLVIEWNTNPNGGYDATSWKMVLHKKYGVRGKALSKRILKDGYDAIITVREFRGKMETSECVDLTVVK